MIIRRVALGGLFLCADIFAHLLHNATVAPMTYIIYMLLDFITILLLFRMEVSKLTIDLAIINLIAICWHGVGFLLYMLYFDPAIYNYVILMIAGCQWVRLIIVRDGDRKANFRRAKDNQWVIDMLTFSVSSLSFHKAKYTKIFKE